jgi:hypothetical protein
MHGIGMKMSAVGLHDFVPSGAPADRGPDLDKKQSYFRSLVQDAQQGETRCNGRRIFVRYICVMSVMVDNLSYVNLNACNERPN